MISFKRNLISKYCLKDYSNNIKGFDEYLAMRHKYILLAVVIGISALLTGCGGGGGGGKDVTCPALRPTITSNAPLGQNDTLELSVFGIDEPQSFTWESSDGWQSHERKMVRPNPPKGNQTYTLSVVTRAGCTYSVSTSDVVVMGPWSPCGLDSNVLKINQVSQVSFTNVQGRTTANNYLIEADNGGLAIADFEFPNNQPPVEGKYTVKAGTGALGANEARVTVSITTQQPFYSSEGTVYVAVNGTSTKISFCDLKFTSANTGVPVTTGGANISWTP